MSLTERSSRFKAVLLKGSDEILLLFFLLFLFFFFFVRKKMNLIMGKRLLEARQAMIKDYKE